MRADQLAQKNQFNWPNVKIHTKNSRRNEILLDKIKRLKGRRI